MDRTEIAITRSRVVCVCACVPQPYAYWAVAVDTKYIPAPPEAPSPPTHEAFQGERGGLFRPGLAGPGGPSGPGGGGSYGASPRGRDDRDRRDDRGGGGSSYGRKYDYSY